MKLGAVMEKFGLSKDNIYFYIKLGLLVPPRRNNQYIFDEAAVTDLEKILELKKLGFTLKEIHRVLSLYRVSHLAGTEDTEELRELYQARREALLDEQKKARENAALLERKIEELHQPMADYESRGVPLTMLSLLACPKCGGSFALDKVKMDQRYIYAGELSCSCGTTALIKNGIVETQSKNTSHYDKPDITRELYKELPPSLLSLFEKAYNRLSSYIKASISENSVILESYVNAWFFLHNHLELLPQGSRLIVLDKFPETLSIYKELSERQKCCADLLYIADSSLNPPLRKNCIDLNVDFFAANEHNFYYPSFWPDALSPYMKENCETAGVYFYFDGGRRSMERLLREYPESWHRSFNKNVFLENAKRAFTITESEELGFTTDSGENLGFSFHEKGEKMCLLAYRMERKERQQ